MTEEVHAPASPSSVPPRQRAEEITALMEELEAVDWYNQRADVCTDPELKAVLEHNRDEEIEHASMTLEWIRRNNRVFDKELREFLFTDQPLSKAADHEH